MSAFCYYGRKGHFLIFFIKSPQRSLKNEILTQQMVGCSVLRVATICISRITILCISPRILSNPRSSQFSSSFALENCSSLGTCNSHCLYISPSKLAPFQAKISCVLIILEVWLSISWSVAQRKSFWLSLKERMKINSSLPFFSLFWNYTQFRELHWFLFFFHLILAYYRLFC